MEKNCVTLRDKCEIVLNDDNEISISIIYNGETKCTFPISYPSGGYGGGSLSLSLSEQYLLFSYFSGESEEAYMLFQIKECRLELIFESGYLYGEDANYTFSNSEELLFQTLPDRMGPWYLEDAEKDENGIPFFRFGEINILNISNKTFNKHILRVYPPDNWDDNMTEESFRISEVTDNCTLHVIMPWGEEKLTYPLDEIIIFKP